MSAAALMASGDPTVNIPSGVVLRKTVVMVVGASIILEAPRRSASVLKTSLVSYYNVTLCGLYEGKANTGMV